MNVFLLVSLIIITIVLLLVNIYLLAIYIHPDDKGFGTSVLPKILVVIGLTLAWGQIFMVPLDVANSRGDGGGLNMDLFWKIILITDAVMLILLIPFAIFMYEGDEEASLGRRICSTACYTIATLIFWCLLIGITYAFLSKAKIPVYVFAANSTTLVSSTSTVSWTSLQTVSTSTKSTMEIDVSFPVYIMGFFTLVGWFFLLLFGGLGLFAIPLDLINSFRYRPKKRTQRELAATKQDLQAKAAELLDLGNNLKQTQSIAGETTGFFAKRRAEGKVGRDKNKFKAAVMAFEMEFEVYTLEKNYAAQNPLIYFLKLVAGCLCFVVSVLWWLQILLYSVIKVNGYPLTGFLNNMLVYLSDKAGVAFIATAIFAFLCIYLMWAVTKGNVKFGIRIPFLFKIHPMKVNETLMNSFLFNVWLLIISSIAAIQFVSNTFANYVRLSTVDILFGTQIKYMKFYQWFYTKNVFEIAFLVWSALGLICLCWCGRNQPKELRKIEELKKKVARNKK